MAATEVIFLGTDSVTPTRGDDTVSLLLNRRVLIDTGWSAALRLLEFDVTPVDLTALFFTHLHHDHYLGLPQILFHRWMKSHGGTPLPPLTIYGPAADLGLVVQLANDFLQSVRFDHRPVLELRPLQPGDSFSIAGLDVTTCATFHAVDGLSYRIRDTASGAELVTAWDTGYHPPLIDHARGADLLIHEASHGPAATRQAATRGGHSGAPDAAELARLAQVRRLALVHGPRDCRAAAVAAAQAIFPPTWWPEPGEILLLESATG